MTQSDLNRAVARRTGETKRCIRRMGFTLLIPGRSARAGVRLSLTKKADHTKQPPTTAFGRSE